MIELLDVMNAIPQPLKAGWAVWVMCGAGLVLWHRRARAVAAPALPAPPPRPRPAPKAAGGVESPPPGPSGLPLATPVAVQAPLPLKLHTARVPAAGQHSATA